MDENSAATTFRLKKSILYQGVGFSLCFLFITGSYVGLAIAQKPAATGIGTLAALWTILILGIGLFGWMLFLSIYLWVAYYVERFSIQGDTIFFRSVSQDHQFDASEVQTLVWPVPPRGGPLQIEVLGAKAKLNLRGYSPADRLAIIRYLRSRIPEPRQQNWPAFCHQVAVPLRDGHVACATPPDIEQLEADAKRLQLVRTLVVVVSTSGLLLTPLLLKLGVDKLTSIVAGMTVLLIGVFGFIPFLPRVKTKWSTEDQQLAVRLWDEGEAERSGELSGEG